MQNLTGLEYGPFKIEELLGHGAFAAVYRVVEKTLDQTLVLKMLAPDYARDARIREMFMREAAVALRLQHPNLVKALGMDERYGRPYIVYPYERGVTLAELIRREDAAEAAFYLKIFCDMARAIDYLHEEGMVHRDIKPDNTLVRSDGIAKLLDFGLVVHTSELQWMTEEALAAGTPPFVAPELMRKGGRPSSSTDIYAFSKTIQKAFERLPMLRVNAERASPGINKGLEEEPSRRPGSAIELAEALCAEVGCV